MAASEINDLAFSVGDPSQIALISSGLNELRLQGTFCDVTIIVGGQRFPAHKAVLTSASDYFQGMFSAGFQESVMSEITVLGNAESFAQIVEFLYTGHFILTPTTVVGVLEMACYMVLTAVVNLCAKYLKNAQDKLTNEDCFEVWSIACNHSNLSDIAKMYRRIVLHNFLKCVQSRLFLENSSSTTMLDILDDEEIETDDITEEQILEGTMIWMRYNWEQRKVHAVDLLKKIRLGLVPVDRLHQILGEELLSVPECKSMVDAVVKLSTNKDTAIPPLNKSHPDMFATRNTITAKVYVHEELDISDPYDANSTVSFVCSNENGCFRLNKLSCDIQSKISGEVSLGWTVVLKTGQLYAFVTKARNSAETESEPEDYYFIRHDTEKDEWCVLPPIPVQLPRSLRSVCALDQFIYVILTSRCRFVIERFNVHSQTWEVMIDHDYEAISTICAECVDDRGILIICDVIVQSANNEDEDEHTGGFKSIGGYNESIVMFYKTATNECLDITLHADLDKDVDLNHLIKYESRWYLVMDSNMDNVEKVYQCTCDFESVNPNIFVGETVEGELHSRIMEELDLRLEEYTFDKRKLEMVPIEDIKESEYFPAEHRHMW